MKRIKYILIIVVAGLINGCGNDWLDLDPSTSIKTEGSLNTLSDFEFTLNGIYSTMQSYYYYGARMQYYGDVTGDDVQAYSATKRCADYYQFGFNKDNAPSTFWRTCYDIIQNTNIVINNIDDIVYEGEDEEGKTLFAVYRDDLKGQALAIRALALFDITRLYGYPYLKDNGASLGGAIVEEVVDITYKPKRSTVAQCYEKIIGYLTTAVPLLATEKEKGDGDWLAKSIKGKMNKWSAMTLLSRVYLYKGDYTNALKMAEEAIKGAEKDGYRLWTNAEYVDAWSKDFTSEVFFEIVNLLTDSPGKESIGYLCSSSGYKDMILTSSFVNFLQRDKNDVRYKMFKISSKRAYIQKYPGQNGDGGPADANVPLFRISELYLNAAEAAVKLQNNDKAVFYLDKIVRRGNPVNTVEGTTVTLDRVLEERRKEFFGEGHRMFDVLRNGGTIIRKNVSISAISSTKHLSLQDYAKEFDWNMYKVVLPIPKAEIDANPNMEQNPEY